MDKIKKIKPDTSGKKSNVLKVLKTLKVNSAEKLSNGGIVVISNKLSEVGYGKYNKVLNIVNHNLTNKLKDSGYYSVMDNDYASVKTDDCGDFIGRIWDGNTHEEAKQDGKKWLDVSVYQAFNGGERHLNIVTNDEIKFSKEITTIKNVFKEFNNPEHVTNGDRIMINTDFIFQEVKKTKLSDLEFAKLPEIKEKAFEMIEAFKREKVRTSYNHLTDLNHHMLVKILNYNGYFDKSLPKKFREELKTFPLYNK